MSKWNPHAQCLSVADLEAPSHTNVESPKAFQESANEFQEFFLNFHFSGSDQRLERASVNTIHFKNPPEALQVEMSVQSFIMTRIHSSLIFNIFFFQLAVYIFDILLNTLDLKTAYPFFWSE